MFKVPSRKKLLKLDNVFLKIKNGLLPKNSIIEITGVHRLNKNQIIFIRHSRE